MADRLERLTNLIAVLLDTRRPLTLEEIVDRVPGYPEERESYRRQFERDKATLREIGVPISLEGFVRIHASFSGGTYHSTIHIMGRLRQGARVGKERRQRLMNKSQPGVAPLGHRDIRPPIRPVCGRPPVRGEDFHESRLRVRRRPAQGRLGWNHRIEQR